MPDGAMPVKPFYKEKYVGHWFEIARMDFRHEKNLKNVFTNYSINEDGSIKVENHGYNYRTKEWKQAFGRAKFVGDTNEARLKVSFFGAFYQGYNVIAVDDLYKYALVAGKNLKYLWLLSRETTMPDKIKHSYLKIAEDIGYDVSALLWTSQS